jgi:hypothetical protein
MSHTSRPGLLGVSIHSRLAPSASFSWASSAVGASPFPAAGHRADLLVRGEQTRQMWAAEQLQHRQVGLGVSALCGRIDDPGASIRRPQDVARPQVSVDQRRRLWIAADLRQSLAETLDGPDVGGRHGAVVSGVP